MGKRLLYTVSCPDPRGDITYRLPQAYFSTVIAHGAPPVGARDCAVFFLTRILYEKLEYSRVLEIDLSDAPLPGASPFWDDYVSISSSIRENRDSDGVLVVYWEQGTSYVFAYYSPSRHLLITVDLVHDPSFAPQFQRLMDLLGLKPRFEVPEDEESAPTWGADPEFEVWDPEEGQVVYAGNVIEEVRQYGTDAYIGLDGARDVAEVRFPRPFRRPELLVEAFYEAVTEWEEETGYRACLSGHVYPIGFHIHIGAPEGEVLAGDIHEAIREIDRRVGYALDLSGDARGYYRRRCAYELKIHGVEYRTPPAALLADPEVAVMYLESIRRIVEGGRAVWGLSRKIKDLEELVRSGQPFGLHCEILRLSPQSVHLDRDYIFSPTFRRVAREITLPFRLRIFGWAVRRGDIVTCPRLAQAFGWRMADGYYCDGRTGYCPNHAIGLPYSIRTSNDAAEITRLFEEVQQCVS